VEQRKTHERRGCTCGNLLKCVVPCAQPNDVMCDASCSISRRQSVDAGAPPCASEKTEPPPAATEGQGERHVRGERAGWDGSWRLWRPGVVLPRRGVLAQRRSRCSRVSCSCFEQSAERCEPKRSVLECRLKENLHLAAGALFAKSTGEEIVPNGWRDTKHQLAPPHRYNACNHQNAQTKVC
jgi:hypothetical protein